MAHAGGMPQSVRTIDALPREALDALADVVTDRREPAVERARAKRSKPPGDRICTALVVARRRERGLVLAREGARGASSSGLLAIAASWCFTTSKSWPVSWKHSQSASVLICGGERVRDPG